MITKINLEVSLKELVIIEKALHNYKGRLIHLLRNESDYYADFTKNKNEIDMLNNLIESLK